MSTLDRIMLVLAGLVIAFFTGRATVRDSRPVTSFLFTRSDSRASFFECVRSGGKVTEGFSGDDVCRQAYRVAAHP